LQRAFLQIGFAGPDNFRRGYCNQRVRPELRSERLRSFTRSGVK
jgi:hypothetical protein